MSDTNILPKDQNYIRAAGFESSSTPGLVMAGQIDEITGRVLVDLPGGGSGTVTSVSVVSANGLAGTVATATTTPAITLSTSITGILKGNGTAISAVTIGSGLSFDGTTLSATGGASGITIGTTTITSGTNTRILYNNAGVVGEYTLTGSGTVVAMQTAPTFSTSITTPSVLATSNDSGAIGASGTAFSDVFLASGAVINFNAGAATITHSQPAGSILTIGGSGATTLALGTNTLTLTGSIAATGARVTKGWFTDIESTNMVTIGGTSLTTVAQTLQNKTITNSNNVLGGVTMTLGSDADGDTYYRASNVLTRLPKGTAAQVLTMNAGATAPEWKTASGGGSCNKVLTMNVLATPGAAAGFKALNSNTTLILNMFNVPQQITVNQIISEAVDMVGTSGTIDISIYSEDGATRYISVTSGTISATGMFNVAVSSVVLPAGNYYLAVNTNSTTSMSVWNMPLDQVTDAFNAYDETNNKPTACGTLTITAGTPPATIDPTAIVADANSNIIFQLNN